MARDAGAPGAPLAHARVRLLRDQDGYHVPFADTVTDASGSARIEAPSGAFWLLVEAPGRARRSERLLFDGDRRRLRVRLPAAEPLQVNVIDEAERPVAEATVLVQGSDPLPQGALTSAEGVALFGAVAEEIEDIRVNARGYDSSVVRPTSRNVTIRLNAPASLAVTVLDGAGRAVAGAEVLLGGLGFWPPRQAQSGPDGVAHMRGLSQGTYDLKAQSGARVSKALVGITLQPGERGQVELELESGRFIPVRVSDGAAGDASPVVGADVVLVEDGLSPFPIQGRTGADGSVTLGPLPPGSAALSVRADGFVPESGVPVPKDAAQEIHIALVRGGRLLGQVVDPDGLPIEGARLEVVGNDLHGRPIARHSGTLNVPRSFFQRSFAAPLPLVPLGELGVMPGPLPFPGMPASGPPPSAAWSSDLDGNYRLDDVPPGRVQVLVRHPDFVESLSDSVTLEPGGEARLRVVLERGATLEGRLIDAAGRPVARARIDAVAPHATQQQTVLSAADGYFAFGGVSLEVDLFVARPQDRYRFVLRRALELEAGKTHQVELVLPVERPATSVVVTGPGGEPIAEAQVSLLSLDPDAPFRQTLYSDASGQALLPDAAGLRGTLRVQAAGHAPFEAQLGSVPERVEVSLARAVAVTGRITHVRGRQGLADAEVVLIQEGERRTTFSDHDGDYEFLDVSPGAAKVSVAHPEFSSQTFKVMIAETGRVDRPFELDPIELEEAGSVSGTVVDASGAPVRGARVGVGLVPAFLPAGPVPPGMVQSDASGHFELHGVREGRVTVSAYAAGAGRGSVSDVDIVARETTTGVEIQLGGAALEAESGALANVAVTLGERARGSRNDVVIVDVAAGSEAERAGLRSEDVLASVDGTPAENMADARRWLGGNDGSDVIVEVWRGEELLTLRVRREPVRR